MKFKSKNYFLVKYEDMAKDIKGTITNVLSELNCSNKSLDFITDNCVNLGENHTVSGNPVRFEKGAVVIKPDTEWKQSFSVSRKWLVTLLTWPLLLKYKYRFFE